MRQRSGLDVEREDAGRVLVHHRIPFHHRFGGADGPQQAPRWIHGDSEHHPQAVTAAGDEILDSAGRIDAHDLAFELAADKEGPGCRIVGDAFRHEQAIVDRPRDFTRPDSTVSQRLECARGNLYGAIAAHSAEVRIVERVVIQRQRRHLPQNAGGVSRSPVQRVGARKAAEESRVHRPLRNRRFHVLQVRGVVLLVVRLDCRRVQRAHGIRLSDLTSEHTGRCHDNDRRDERAHEARRWRQRGVAQQSIGHFGILGLFVKEGIVAWGSANLQKLCLDPAAISCSRSAPAPSSPARRRGRLRARSIRCANPRRRCAIRNTASGPRSRLPKPNGSDVRIRTSGSHATARSRSECATDKSSAAAADSAVAMRPRPTGSASA